MDWPTYRQLCDRPDCWSRWMLDQCAELLLQLDHLALAQQLTQAAASPPLPTPPDHRGPPATWMHRLQLTPAERAQIYAAVCLAQQRGLSTAATEGRGLGGFVEAWREYAEFEG